jgi:hypothetical protein
MAGVLLYNAAVAAQTNTAELRLTVTDQAGLAPGALVELSSRGAQFDHTFLTGPSGAVDCKELPTGLYLVRVSRPGFAPAFFTIELRSAIRAERAIHLELTTLSTTVRVDAVDTLLDPGQPSSVMQIGATSIQDRVASLPGRSVQDLVKTQPGWLYEGNAVLHPRGSEYQTQFVVDGIPLTDNRSPGLGPEIEADDLSSMSIYTAGIPAEYGRKMGGVVELNTRRDIDPGLHGQAVLSGGSYTSASSFGGLQYLRGRNTFDISASGSTTAHYFDPVVPENFTNTATLGDFSARYERDLSPADRLTFNIRHEFSRFLIPNELVQQQAGQRQHGDNVETMGSASFQHSFAPDALLSVVTMARHNANNLISNAASTPILPLQHNFFSESYAKASFSLHHHQHDFKAGIESDVLLLHENFSYTLTDPAQFDPATPPSFSFAEHRPDIEPSAFAEDLFRSHNWTVAAGLRYDHYQLLLNQSAFSPRLSVARYFPSAALLLHASFDRVFQTPAFENILLSSSPQVDALSSQFLRLPVEPSRGEYYEAGLTHAFSTRARLDLNVYRRNLSNFADDNQLLNTEISYPISFRRAVVYGAESRFELVRLGPLSGVLSYSYMVANVWLPVTGGLFLGDDAAAAAVQQSGHVPDSQDQRHTASARFRYQAASRLWFAAGFTTGSGLPFEYTGTSTEAAAQYGPAVISRLNFARGRVLPSLSVDATVAAEIYHRGERSLRLQADGTNLNDRLNVIDFGGLFSGNAIGPARSFSLRLSIAF